MIKIAICDDCAEDREVLITQINEVGKKINNTLDNDFQIKEYSCGQVLLEQMREIAFDIIFLDPPYQTNYIEKAIFLIEQYGMLKKDGIIVCESDQRKLIVFSESYQIYKERKYGDKSIVILEKI